MSAVRTVGTGPLPHALPGLDPTWSRTVVVPDGRGRERTWHLLDNGAEPVHGTLVCVHGNPTWSYLWRGLLGGVPAGWRVIAPDQLGMGYSERLGDDEEPWTVAERVADLGRLTDALGVDGPVVSVGHDWGGIISLGWALDRRERVIGAVVGNTAVAQPPGDFGPPLIRLAHTPGVRPFGCVATPIFVRATSALSSPALPKDVRDALALPYGDAHRRRSVGDFVADIPFAPGHPSYPVVAGIAEDVKNLDVPALMMWGPRDPVFGERYLRDLRDRLPRARVHRFEGASHLVTEDAPEHVDAVAAFLDDLLDPPASDDARPAAEGSGDRMWTALEARADDDALAVAAGGGTVSWRDLASRVAALAAGLRAAGVQPGDRIGLLVEPSTDLTTIVYAAWRAGAVVVVADKGLGFAGMRRALRGGTLDHVVGHRTGLAAARAMGLPGSRISVEPLPAPVALLLGVSQDLEGLVALGAGAEAPPEPDLDADCAILFTSGATGPAKGVAYTHRQARAEVDLVRATYDLGPDDAFVAAFAPFALFGPAFGIASSVPAIDVTAPHTLTAPLLADAASAVDATVVFASPAALRRVVATRDDLTDPQRTALAGVRLLMSAGAPVPLPVLEQVAEVVPGAALHTPYGMTEALPATDVSLAQIREAGPGEGVCVGRPLAGVRIGVVPFGRESDGPVEHALPEGGTGEICVSAPHVKDRYDDLWLTQRRSASYVGWHRTGDVGHLDDEGRLWVEGRLGHVVRTADGVVTPVGVEQRAESVPGVSAAAAVGVGPEGTQQLVVVVVPDGASSRRTGPRGPIGVRGADLDLADAVRAAVGTPVAAVLAADRLPLDVRHSSKVDRSEVARQAARSLAGR
ncbi:alpha/beta fold hydrolase [uncultured Nocardioides sp.]|uniref:alpha/beta fold hydrolase n=1 Tax=uncultured Nocardioides sp. TaxID=198441 RepID=UPI00260B85C2|nr:alpha/beta fold hydrolase [uncultured Nocardioides sp.]